MRSDECHILLPPRAVWKESRGGQACRRPVTPISGSPHPHGSPSCIATTPHTIPPLLTQEVMARASTRTVKSLAEI